MHQSHVLLAKQRFWQLTKKVFIATQLNWPSWTAYSQVSRVFVYDVTTYKLSQLLFTLWTCRQLDVELSSVELSCVAINRPQFVRSNAKTLSSKLLWNFCRSRESAYTTILQSAVINNGTICKRPEHTTGYYITYKLSTLNMTQNRINNCKTRQQWCYELKYWQFSLGPRTGRDNNIRNICTKH